MSRNIEAIIKHTGVIPEKNSSAKYQTMKAIRIHKYGEPEVLSTKPRRVRSHKPMKF